MPILGNFSEEGDTPEDDERPALWKPRQESVLAQGFAERLPGALPLKEAD